MRRNDREIKGFNEIVEVMKKCDVCRLGLNSEDYPYIVPLNFGMSIHDEEITLYFHGANEGKKYDLINRDNRVSFEMDCLHRIVTDDKTMSCTMEYECVMGEGKIEIVTDDEKYDALCEIMKHYHKEDFQFNKNIIPMTNVFKMVVKNITGKRRMKK